MALNIGEPREAFKELLEHRGHKIECVTYGATDENVALECVDCSTVLLDYDAPIESDEKVYVTINGVRIEYQGAYGDEGGGVYVYDDARNVEIVMWDMAEWIAEPSLLAVIAEVYDYAQAHGVEGVAGRFKPDYLELHAELEEK